MMKVGKIEINLLSAAGWIVGILITAGSLVFGISTKIADTEHQVLNRDISRVEAEMVQGDKVLTQSQSALDNRLRSVEKNESSIGGKLDIVIQLLQDQKGSRVGSNPITKKVGGTE